VPGEPATVGELARRYRDTADAIRTAVDGLRQLRDDTDGQEADSVDKLRELARDTSTDIAKAEDRYRMAATALTGWQGHLSEAQRKADAALHRASEALCAPRPAGEGDGPQIGPAEDPVVTAAKSDVAEAVSDWNTHGHEAAQAVDSALEANGLNDGWRDKLANVLKAIGNLASLVATIAGILALVLCWVPVVGQVLAAVALVATAISLVCKLSVGGLTGEWDVMGIVWDTVSLATFGVGRAFSAAARGSSQAAVRTGRTAAMRAGRVPGAGGQPTSVRLMGGNHVTSGAVSGYARATSSVNARGVLGGYRSAFPEFRAGMPQLVHSLRGGGWNTAYEFSSGRTALNTIFGSTNTATDLGTAGRYTDDLMRLSDDANRARTIALRQNNVEIGAHVVNSGIDVYQFGVEDGGGVVGDGARAVEDVFTDDPFIADETDAGAYQGQTYALPGR
jgi:hypothetical protein